MLLHYCHVGMGKGIYTLNVGTTTSCRWYMYAYQYLHRLPGWPPTSKYRKSFMARSCVSLVRTTSSRRSSNFLLILATIYLTFQSMGSLPAPTRALFVRLKHRLPKNGLAVFVAPRGLGWLEVRFLKSKRDLIMTNNIHVSIYWFTFNTQLQTAYFSVASPMAFKVSSVFLLQSVNNANNLKGSNVRGAEFSHLVVQDPLAELESFDILLTAFENNYESLLNSVSIFRWQITSLKSGFKVSSSCCVVRSWKVA